MVTSAGHCSIDNNYIDLARAKSEALFNIYSLLKQNIKLFIANQAVTAAKTAKIKKSNRSN